MSGYDLSDQILNREVQEFRKVSEIIRGFASAYRVLCTGGLETRWKKIIDHGRIAYVVGDEWKPMHPTPCTKGYLQTSFSYNGWKTPVWPHQLVAEYFIPKPANVPYLEVGHLDDCRTNNHLYNLDWVTHEENMAQMVRRGRSMRGERHHKAILTWGEVQMIRMEFASGLYPLREVARMHAVNSGTIYGIVRNETWFDPDYEPSPFHTRSQFEKLSFERAEEIRRLFATGQHSMTALAKLFNVSLASVSLVINNKSWVRP